MKTKLKSALSFVMCLVMCMGLLTPAFAANDQGVTFEVTLDRPTISVSKEYQTVIMTLKANDAVSVDGIAFNIIKDGHAWDDSWATLESVVGSEEIGAYNAAATNLTTGTAGWTTTTFENVDTTVLAVITINIPANTAAGTYSLGINALELTADMGEIWESDGSAVTTLTIEKADDGEEEEEAPTTPTSGYTASLTTTTPTVTVGNTVTVNVGVSHSDANETGFNAAEVMLDYDAAALTLDTTSLGNLKYTNENGVLTIEDFGADKTFSSANYAIKFTAAKVTDSTTVTLASAKFINKTNATTSDLIAAAKDPAFVEIKINEVTYDVTLPTDGKITGNAKATKGQDYTFTVAEPNNYTYTITVKVNNAVIDTVVNNGNGNYTIPASSVTGPIEITYTRTENKYNVTTTIVDTNNTVVSTDTAENAATYNKDYEFTLPEGTAAGLESGIAYELKSVTIGGTAYTGYSVSDGTYTIPGGDITGAIVITITEKTLDANKFTVTVEGTGAGNASVSSDEVAINGTAFITVTPESGYSYTVTATMGGNAVTVSQNGNTYSVSPVTANVVFTVEKTLGGTVVVYDYITLNSETVDMLLVTYTNTLTGKVPTYDGNAMFWSEKYNAYCWLVNAATLSVEDATANISAKTADAATDPKVAYGKDINLTETTDAADAQVVYNMYTALYGDFTSGVTMAQFLAADQNGDKQVDTSDALVIIDYVLNSSASN